MSPLPAHKWENVLEGFGRTQLETVLLPEYLPKQRWFGGKARRIRGTRILDWGELGQGAAVLALVEVRYESGDPDTYLAALAMSYGPDTEKMRKDLPNAVLSAVVSQRGRGLLHDASLDEAASTALLSLIESGGQVQTRHGTIRGAPGAVLPGLRGSPVTPLAPARMPAEQSNTSVIYGDRLILKLFRRQQPGPNPDSEIGRYLTETAGFDGVAPFGGTIEYERAGEAGSTLAVLQGLVANEGDGWKLMLEELERYYENCARVPVPEGTRGQRFAGSDRVVGAAAEPIGAGSPGHRARRSGPAGKAHRGAAPRFGGAIGRPGIFSRAADRRGPAKPAGRPAGEGREGVRCIARQRGTVAG